MGKVYLTMGILCISMGQPASLALRISADTTWAGSGQAGTGSGWDRVRLGQSEGETWVRVRYGGE